MRNFIYKWALELSISRSITLFIYYIYVRPELLTLYFNSRNNNTFFISDRNLFAYRYRYNNLFAVYRLYAPSFILRCLCWLQPISLFINKYFIYQVGFILIYLHIISGIFNSYDFSDNANNYKERLSIFNVNSIDFIIILIQYQGYYWDFFFISILYYGVFFFFNEKSKRFIYFIYEQNYLTYSINKSISEGSMSVFTLTWAFRLFSYSFVIYFFGGESREIDGFNLIITIFFTELSIFSYRCIFFFQSFHKL